MANPILMLLEGNGSLGGRDRSGSFTATGSGALRYAPDEGARINMCPDPMGRGNSGTGQWLVQLGATITADGAITDAPSVQGVDRSREAVTNGTLNGGLIIGNGGTTKIRSATATASIWIKIIAATAAVNFGMNGFNQAAGYIGAGLTGVLSQIAIPTSAAGQGWIQYLISGPIGTNAEKIAPFISCNGTATYRVSALCISEGTFVSLPYVDGRTTGAVWLDPYTGFLGTADASPSVSRAAFWVEEATTNLCINPSFETDISNTVTSGVTRSRVTTRAYTGSSSMEVVTANAAPNEYVYVRTAGSLGYTGSARSFVGQCRVQGASGEIMVRCGVLYTDVTADTGAATTVTLTGGWQRIVTPAMAVNSAKTVDFMWVLVSTTTQQALTFYVDAVQLEEKAYATSYCDGSLGTGYTWAGTAHASASTRAVTAVYTAIGSRVNGQTGSWVTRSVRRIENSSNEDHIRIGAGNVGFDSVGMNSVVSDVLRVHGRSNAGAFNNYGVATIVEDIWATLYGWYTGSLVGGQVLSGGVGSISGAWTPAGAFDPLDSIVVGSSSTGGSTNLNGYIGDVAIYDRALTAAERAAVSARITGNLPLWNAIEDNAYARAHLRG